MGTCPKPDAWALMRECYAISLEGPGDEPILTNVPFSSLKKGDLFTLEAVDPGEDMPIVDVLYGLPLSERTYLATSEPYHVDNTWQIETEKI